MNDLGWGRAGGNGGNGGTSGNKGSGGSLCTAYEDGVCIENGRGLEGARKASGGFLRGAR